MLIAVGTHPASAPDDPEAGLTAIWMPKNKARLLHDDSDDAGGFLIEPEVPVISMV
jgi:hypothetical protein